MRKTNVSRVMLVCAMTLFGTIGFFVRHITLGSGQIALYRAVIAMAVMGLYLLLTKQGIGLKNPKKQLPLLAFSGVAIGINWILLFEAYRYTTISLATLSYYFAPVLVTLVCPVLFREKLTVKQILCFVMSTLGLAMITGFGASGRGTDTWGVVLGLGAAVFYAGAVITNKYIRDVDGMQRTFWQFSAAVIVLLPYAMFTGGFQLQQLGLIGWGSLLLVGLVHTGLCYCLYFSALKELPGQKTAILSYIDPLVAVVISVILLQEKMTFWQLAGGILILGFTLLNELGPKEKKQ